MGRFNRQKCCSTIRATFTDVAGNTYTLMGKHAFEWSIVTERLGTVKITVFPNSKPAKKDFKNLKKQLCPKEKFSK